MTPPGAAELVLEQLVDAEGTEVPAMDTALKLGLTPGEMFAAVEALRSSGYEIRHVERPPHHGMILLHGPDRPLEAELNLRLRTRTLGRNLVFKEEVDSTNTLALRLAGEGAVHGTVVIAARQTSGRGRRGRAWLSLPGQQLFISVLLRPSLPPDRAFELTIVAVVALAEALESCGVLPEIKWPNDVEVGGRKIAGILCESAFEPDGKLRCVIVGLGSNIDADASEIPDELRGRATSLRAETRRTGLTAPLAAAFLERLEEWLVLHESLGFETVLEAWRGRSTTLDSEVRALVDNQVITGVAEDVDSAGALLVRDPEGRVHRIIAGEVTTLRRLASTHPGH